MQISASILLNSAESILRDRQREAQAGEMQEGQGNLTRAAKNRNLISHSVLESRLLKLQASLSSIQKDYSREQARLHYVTERPQDIDASLVYDNQPLFPEWKGKATPEMQFGIKNGMDGLLRKLRRIQVEMENLYALNFNSLPKFTITSESLSQNPVLNELDPKRVAQLTQE